MEKRKKIQNNLKTLTNPHSSTPNGKTKRKIQNNQNTTYLKNEKGHEWP